MAVPGCQILVANRPVGAMSVKAIGTEIMLAQTIGLPVPEQRFATQLVGANPAKFGSLGGAVGHLPIIAEKMFGGIAEGIALLLDLVIPLQQLQIFL